MLQKSILSGRLGKWAYAPVEYDLTYEPIKAMKGQVLADFIVDHCVNVEGSVCLAGRDVWKLFFDGSVCSQGQGIGCVIVSPHGVEYELSIRLEFECTNNQAEYEALLTGLETLVELGALQADIFGDSNLVGHQINDESQFLDGRLNEYCEECLHLLSRWERVSVGYILLKENTKADTLVQQVSGCDVRRGWFKVRHKAVTAGAALALEGDEGIEEPAANDWRKVLIDHINNPNHSRDKKVRRQVMNYTLIDGKLYHRTTEGMLLKCLSEEEAKAAMGDVHEEMCGAHQAVHKMKWTLRRVGVFWPTTLKGCFDYYKGCESCQKFGKLQTALASMLHPIVKPWPFRGRGLYFIGEIHPTSTKGHHFVLMATDYFTKSVEAVPLRRITHREVINFVLEHIVYLYGILQTLTMDQRPSFMARQFKEFARSLGIKLLNSSPYYAQANGEASSKILIGLIKKKMEEKPRRWHEVLLEALWAYWVSKHGAIKMTLFELLYGQEAMLLVEISAQTSWVMFQDSLWATEYRSSMMDETDDLLESRLIELWEIEKEKLKVAKLYNKRVKEKSFHVGDLVWKTILPLGARDSKFGKWSPSWEGPLTVTRIVSGNTYFIESLRGEALPKAINGKYLKRFYPNVW
jgi:ribonuclease HI